MTVVYNLLNLQAKGIADLTYRAMFEESRNRIMSMSMIHESLYRSEDLAYIDFNKYLRVLIDNIWETYNRPGVALVLSTDPLALDITVGIPYGLIVNKLVSNSLKYAFPEGRTGEIRVGVTKNSEGNNVLPVKDNGISFLAELDFRNTSSLGLQVTNGLTSQLKGKFELTRKGGTNFRITFAGSPGTEGLQNG